MALRDVWRQRIAAADYDAHMDQNGQTQAGASAATGNAGSINSTPY